YHVDPVGSILFPALAIFGPFMGFKLFSGMLIGWAKPTPVLGRNFQNIRRDENMVTLAGPVSNLALAGVALLLLLVLCHAVPGNGAVPSGRETVLAGLGMELLEGVNPSLQAAVLLGVAAIQVNLSLFVFNLFPIPPLDGNTLLRNMLPYNAMQAYDRIPYWVSWLLMIVIGGTVMRIVLAPMFGVVYLVLARG